MAVIARLKREHIDEMIKHAREEAPIECCGILAKRDGTIVRVYRAKNAEASPYRFSIDAREQLRIQRDMDDEGTEWAGFYHSHTGTPAVPSPTDIRQMSTFFGPPYVHFLVGIADPDNPELRVWYIENGDKTEHEYELVD